MTLLAGVALCVALALFEGFVTNDMRWVLWAGSAGMLLLAAWLTDKGRGAAGALLASLPLAVFFYNFVVVDEPRFWPHVAIVPIAALAGWLLIARRPLGIVAVLSVALLGAGYGNLVMPRLLADFNEYLDEPAPEISLVNLDGSVYPADAFEGKILVLDFFATWCVPCRAELPEIEAVRQALIEREDILFLVVGDGDSGDTPAQVAEFADAAQLDLPFVYDPGGLAHDALGFTNIPSLAVIDKKGHVRLKRIGYNAAETGFQSDLIALLGSL